MGSVGEGDACLGPSTLSGFSEYLPEAPLHGAAAQAPSTLRPWPFSP